MIRVASVLARCGVAIALGLLVLAVTRWAPIGAEAPVDVRALSVAPWLLGFAVIAALTARPHRPARWRPLAWGLAAAAVLLFLAVVLRGPGGLPGLARTSGGERALPPGPIDVTAGELSGLGVESVTWRGTLDAPQSGHFGLRLEGRGRVVLRLDGRPLLSGEAEQLELSGNWLIGRGTHDLQLDWELTGSPEARGPGVRGHRLRLAWVRPRRNGHPGGVDETIPARYLGGTSGRIGWRLTDVLSLAVALLAVGLALRVPWDTPALRRRPGPLGARELAVSLGAYAILAVVMSWPMATDLARRGPLYREDGRLNTWILAWVAHAVTTHPTGLFQAPIFHPSPDALAFSENLLLPGILAAPASLSGEPVLGYNLVFLLSAIVGGLGVQLLVRRLAGDSVAGFVAGALFAFGAHRWTRMAHLHAHVSLFLPFVLLALDRFHERPTLRRALLVGLLLGLQGLSSIYLGAITATLVVVVLAAGALGGWRGRELLRLGAGLLLAAALLAPVARPYLRMRQANDTEWSQAEIAPHEVTIESYLASPGGIWSPVSERELDPLRVRQPLFPGLVLVVMGVVGVASAPRRLRVVAIAAAVFGVVLSLGSETPVHPWLHAHVVAFRGVRALGRFALLPVLSLVVLTGVALASRRRLAAGVLVLGLAEAAAMPIRLDAYDPPRPASRWLAGRPGAVLDWPIGERDTEAMLQATAHFRPLVNGYSGYTPRQYRWVGELMDDPAQPETLRYLRAVDVRHVVARAGLALPLAAGFGDERVYLVPPGERAQAPGPGEPSATLWSADTVTLDLGKARGVSRLVVPVGERPWSNPPRLEVSADGRNFEVLGASYSSADAALSVALQPLTARAELRFGCRLVRMLRLSGVPVRPGLLETDASCSPAPGGGP